MNWAVPESAPTLLVSDTGRVIRMASSRRKGKGWQTFPEKELSPRKIGSGYLGINCKIEGKKMNHYVHRLVAEAFLGPAEETAEVNHKDGVKTNNALSNLEWVTHSANHCHASAIGLNPKAKITADVARAIKNALAKGTSQALIAKTHNVSKQIVSKIKHGHTWSWVDDAAVMASRG